MFWNWNSSLTVYLQTPDLSLVDWSERHIVYEGGCFYFEIIFISRREVVSVDAGSHRAVSKHTYTNHGLEVWAWLWRESPNGTDQIICQTKLPRRWHLWVLKIYIAYIFWHSFLYYFQNYFKVFTQVNLKA